MVNSDSVMKETCVFKGRKKRKNLRSLEGVKISLQED